MAKIEMILNILEVGNQVVIDVSRIEDIDLVPRSNSEELPETASWNRQQSCASMKHE